MSGCAVPCKCKVSGKDTFQTTYGALIDSTHLLAEPAAKFVDSIHDYQLDQCGIQNKILIVLGQKVCTISAMLKLPLYVSPARTRDPRLKHVGIDAIRQLNEPWLTRYDIFDRFCRGSNEIEVHRTTRARGLRTE